MENRYGPAQSRRGFLRHAAACGIGLGAWPLAQAQGDALLLAQSIALSGPLADLGQAMHEGARACFAAVNAQGGINGRRIELMTRDDGYDVKRAVENLKAFIADPKVFALFNCMGTPMIEALLPLIKGSELPCFAPFTGATSARPADMRNVFNIRASYPEEAERLIEHLATIGIRRIALACQNNSFGKEVAQAAEAALQRRQLQAVAMVTVENSGADADGAATKVVSAAPEAVVLGLAGKPAAGFVRAIRAQRKGLSLYALSVMGSAATLNALGDDAVGIAVSQVVPLPSNGATPVVRDFLQAWRTAGVSLEPSHLALEGYINARVFVEALRHAGTQLTRAHFIDAAWGLKRLDLGGYELGFDRPGRSASRFVELTMVGKGGRFIR